MKWSQHLALGIIRAKFRVWTKISPRKAAEKAFALFCTPQRRNTRTPPRIFEEAERLQFRLRGHWVKGWRWQAGAERKVLILHGYESSATSFERYIRPLLRKGYEVLAFDAPAHGRSGGREINAPLYKQMIREIHDHYGPVQSYLAHSFGGLCVCLALEEISHTDDYRLALVAPATETTTAIDTFFRFLQLDPVLRPEFDKVIIRRGGVSPSWYSIRRAMKHIRARVLWVHDEDDDTTPLADALRVRDDGHRNLQFHITQGLGHRRIYRDNQITRLIVEFL